MSTLYAEEKIQGAHGHTWIDLLRDRAEREPGRIACTFIDNDGLHETRLDYADLDRRARAIAAWLQARCAPGDRVMVLLPPGLDFVAGFVGCLYAGMIAVPGKPPQARSTDGRDRGLPRINAIARNAEPAAILTMAGHSPVIDDSGLAALHRLNIDEVVGDWESAWTEPQVAPSTPAYLQYTSGSTSTPRGAVITHANLMDNAAAIAQAFEHTRQSTAVIWLPPYHDMGLMGGILHPLYVGFQAVLMSPMTLLQHPLRWLQVISKYGKVTSGGPNFAYDLCVRSVSDEDKKTLDLSGWDLAFVGAEPIRNQTLDRFARAFACCGFRPEAFYPCYGLAEATLMVTGTRKGTGPVVRRVESDSLSRGIVKPASESSAAAAALVSSGRSCSDYRVVIVDPATRRPCGDNKIGEVWVAGGCVADGYWNDDHHSREVFSAVLDGRSHEPFLQTGDLGFLCEGELFITGRRKELIIVRGVNHYPHDIEATVQQAHPAVEGCCGAAFAFETGEHEHVVIVQEVKRTQRNCKVDEVIDAIRASVSDHHGVQPHAIVLVKPAQIPRTSSGKIQRACCRDLYLNSALEIIGSWHQSLSPPARDLEIKTKQSDHTANATPLHDLESWLTGELAAAIGATPEQVDPAEPFVRYGLDSASAVNLAARVADRVGCELPATLFWDHPTVQLLAQYLTEHCKQSEAPSVRVASPLLIPLRFTGTRPPLFIVHGRNGQAYVSPSLVRALGHDQPVHSFQARGLIEGDRPHARIDRMAADYISQMRLTQPEGPYFVAGFCAGGIVAHEMACQLQESGETVGLLLLIDPPKPLSERPLLAHWRELAKLRLAKTRFKPRASRRTLDNILRNLRRRGVPGVTPFRDDDPVQTARAVRVALDFLIALNCHTPRAFHGQVHAIGSRARLSAQTWQSGMWRQGTRGPIEMVEVGHDHAEVLEPDNQRLISAVASCVDAAQRAAVTPAGRIDAICSNGVGH